MPIGVILAGGRSSRMGGGDKGLLRLGDKTLIAHVADRLAPQLPGGRAALRLNANGDPARFAELALPVIPDEAKGFAGPLAGVLAGLTAARRENARAIVTAAADTPFLPQDLVAHLSAALADGDCRIALAATRDAEGKLWPHPTFGLWPSDLAEDLREALVEEGVRKVLVWAERHGMALVEFDAAGAFDPFFNVNTPADLEEARALWNSGAASGEPT